MGSNTPSKWPFLWLINRGDPNHLVVEVKERNNFLYIFSELDINNVYELDIPPTLPTRIFLLIFPGLCSEAHEFFSGPGS